MCNSNTRRKKKRKWIRRKFEAVMTENLPKLMTDSKPHIQEAQRTMSRINI